MLYVFFMAVVLLVGLISVALIGFGVYEFYVEHKQDMKSLHMKHLDRINSGR